MKEKRSKNMMNEIESVSAKETECSRLLHRCRKELRDKNKELKIQQEKMLAAKEEISKVNQDIENVLNMKEILSSLNKDFEEQIKKTNQATCVSDLENVEEELQAKVKTLQEVTQNVKYLKTCVVMQQEAARKNDMLPDRQSLLTEITSKENVFTYSKGLDERLKWSRLDIQERRLKIHSLMTDIPPSSCCLSLDECLTTFTGTKRWPRKAFLKLGSNESVLDDVILNLSEVAEEATDEFLRMCLGASGTGSFKGMGPLATIPSFLYLNSFIQLPAEVNSRQLLKKKLEWEEGEVVLKLGNGNSVRENVFELNVCVDKTQMEWECIPIGEVECGIDSLKKAFEMIERGEDVAIIDSGLIVDLKD